MKSIAEALTWEIEENPLFDEKGNKISGWKTVKRSDTGKILNVCKKSYTPTYNTKFIDTIQKLQEITGFEFTGLSEFDGGKKMFAHLKNTNQAKVGDYPVNSYLFLGNGHDGNTGFCAGTTQLMIRCKNQFSQIERATRINHTLGHSLKIDSLVAFHKQFEKQNQELITKMEEFAKVDVSIELRKMLIKNLFDADNNLERLSTVKVNQMQKLESCIRGESQDLGSNLLGFIGGVTNYTTHFQKVKNPVFGNILGIGAELNKKAFDMCLQLT
ncbi:MAG TPA: DUF932 domain-containing protein [Patescibacteria group bacterium]|nr:DUF932 domain-containing protein [Patescibacteria group bacterium]